MDKITDILSFPENLRKVMELNNLKSVDVAKGCGLTPAAISQILTRKRRPTLQSAIKIAKYLDVSIDSLVGPPYKEKCFRCGADANQIWNICADGNQNRFICNECDIALNETVLEFMGFDDRDKMMEKYKATLLDADNG